MVKHFSYAARQSGGMKVWGEIIALNIEQALTALQESGVYVTRIEPLSAGRQKAGRARRVVLSAKEKSLLVQTWSRLIDSGFPMDAALSRLQTSTQHPSVRRALHETQRLIRDGMTLGEAVEASGLLPPSWAAVLEMGQKRGDLVGPMMVLQKRSEQIRKTVQEVVSALLMPTVLITLVFIWVWIFASWLLPVMAQTIVEVTGTSNPLLVGLKGLTTMTLPAAICAVGVLGFLILGFVQGDRSDGLMGTIPAWVPMRFPLIGSLISKVYLIVVASELQLQLEAGIPILTALQTLSKSVPKRAIREDLAQAYRRISGGELVWKVIGDLGMVPARFLPLLAAGQAGGKLPELLGVLVRETSLDLEAEAYRLAVKMRSCGVVMAGIIVGIFAVSMMTMLSCTLESITLTRLASIPPDLVK